MGEWRYSSTHSLSSALDGGGRSASRSGRFTLKERAPGTHWIGLLKKLLNIKLFALIEHNLYTDLFENTYQQNH